MQVAAPSFHFFYCCTTALPLYMHGLSDADRMKRIQTYFSEVNMRAMDMTMNNTAAKYSRMDTFSLAAMAIR